MIQKYDLSRKPTADLLKALDSILSARTLSLAGYIGYAHLAVAEILHKWMPGRYAIMDKAGRHRELFHWRIVGHCEDFVLRDYQPPRPDSLKVPFLDEGLPACDFLIWDTPLYPNQLAKIVTRSYRPPPAVILLADEATETELPDDYHWEAFTNHVIGRHKNPSRLTQKDLGEFDARVALLQKHFAQSLDEHLKREGLQTFDYVGNPELIRKNPERHSVSGKDILSCVFHIFLRDQDRDGLVPCTYIIDRRKDLWVAERRSEHVACAHGEPVLAAGELFIEKEKKYARIARISNLSTGYCPPVETWSVVHSLLSDLRIDHPEAFDPCCEFRRCEACANLQIVKNDDWTCASCRAPLSGEWNISPQPYA